MNDLKRFGLRMVMALAAVVTMASCDSAIYDDEGDCSVTYRLKFRYDMNMKFADAFSNEVKSVSVYAYDKSGKLVWQKAEKGDNLAKDGYTMTIDLPAGDYDLVAWCGLDNGANNESFTVGQQTIGSSTRSILTCSLNRKHDADGNAYVDTDLYGLYHGELSVNLPTNDDGGEYTYEMPLTKDTNHLRVILQQLSGKDLNVDDFTFTVTSDNGLMDYDNSLIDDETIIYRAWNIESGKAGIDSDSETTTSVSAAIADMTFGRLTTDRKTTLSVKNKEGKTVIKIPVVDYALMVKGNYNESMSNQEYLDRQDEWSMTFFIDESGQWVSSSVIINSWRVVLQNFDLQ